jgi:hypothetical protein
MQRLVFTLFTGCFAPAPVTGSPCPTGVCPTGLVCSPATQTCEVSAVDASATVDARVLVDAAPGCFGIGLVAICPTAPVTSPLTLPSSIDTAGPACLPYTGSQPGELCVVAGTTITVDRIVLVRGSRPLVVLASDTITITATGTLDAASTRGGGRGAGSIASSCVAHPAQGDRGGPGGSFGGRGGFGGEGETAGREPSEPVPQAGWLRGGCDGGASMIAMGGAGGGAVYLVAGVQIRVSGTINASGAGGGAGTTNRGGAGGGSGGMIGLDAPVIEVTGSIFANGGGGGASDTDATAGQESLATAGVGRGGRANDGGGADGGDGAAGVIRSGRDGARGNDGGGGGGGGAGVIVVFPPRLLPGNISPPAT